MADLMTNDQKMKLLTELSKKTSIPQITKWADADDLGVTEMNAPYLGFDLLDIDKSDLESVFNDAKLPNQAAWNQKKTIGEIG